ncbi:hypothetical protein THAOC_02546 [Thalassiosira oceanica]|uniref:Uncharacterized protein n=1 Tax=Thalassiosira oceanica TaxID=159749 RepID=K0TQA8_THAOC|nr:hypothetical protein THAOC_02546 [Thalassiosira oceanica]|mmetsp:Transcript_35735/g.85206  ORF Transcript_35735/g.85206 Transcript_35735/m.85206 type:complete len:270 (+) Transcript_35735:207-1016(+)|eukprot:EJK75722.1 hypothetical protein THAOC_02546 [Thalassiosira oceanica]
MEQDNGPVGSVFGSSDLMARVLLFNVDSDGPPSSYMMVCKRFREAFDCNAVWEKACEMRWRRKFGFSERWRRASEDFLKVQTVDGGSDCHDLKFWKCRYFHEEVTGQRETITPHELSDLSFDFRFFIGAPGVEDGSILIKSGLLESASKEVRFSSPTRSNRPLCLYEGDVKGHPTSEAGIKWFLREGNELQWGFPPNLWPRGVIRRLDNWGWEVVNPNVVLRAVDDHLDDEVMWSDLITSLELIPINNPNTNGFPVYAQLPSSFRNIRR